MSWKYSLMVLSLCVGLQAHAANNEAPPNEPPYTNDNNEFDQLLSEAAPANNPRTTTQKEEPPPKGMRRVYHPNSKKGLTRIEADGTYVYKVKTNPTSQTGTLRFAMMDPPNIESADGNSSFKQMYTSDPIFTLMVDYEWQPFKQYGKFGVQTGMGLAMAQGSGRFISSGEEAMEKYNFVMIPLNVGLIYRLEFMKRQWVAPYLSGGGTYMAVAEMRDDGKNNFSGSPAGYGGVGAMFNITAMDKDMAFTMDSEYGIGNLWLVAEYRFQKSFSEDLDFTGSIISLGVSADF